MSTQNAEKLSKPRILFVDDEQNVLDALRRMLRGKREEWEMIFTTSGEEALKAQRALPFDVVVTDMKMPGMNGFEVIHALIGISSTSVPIVLTGTADLETAVTAINQSNVFRFYTKPCPAGELQKGITAALLHRRTLVVESTPPSRVGSRADPDTETALLDRLSIGTIVVGREAEVLSMNRTGADLVARSDGLVMDSKGICRASVPDETRKLHALIQGAMEQDLKDEDESVIPLARPSGKRPLTVAAFPMHRAADREGGPSTEAVLLVNDPERLHTPSPRQIANLLDLTMSESRLACKLAGGMRLEDAASELGLTPESARTYLKRVFAKTDTGRQAELVRLILISTISGKQG